MKLRALCYTDEQTRDLNYFGLKLYEFCGSQVCSDEFIRALS